MLNKLKDYFGVWSTIMLRPIYFYTRLKREDWRAGSLSFLFITSWLLAGAASSAIFIIQYIPIGGTLLEKVPAAKIIIVAPVMLVLGSIFFFITLFIAAGLFVSGLLAGLTAIAGLLHYTFQALGGKGQLNQIIQSVCYSSAAILVAATIFILMMLTKYVGMDFTLFRFGFNTIYNLLVLYLYGLWAVAGRKTYGISKTKAFVGALAPVSLLLILGFLFDKIIISRLQSWIS
ncbi:YIP1 family protein [Candidatus Saganbacteria bacterium]|nr:YIP1 family protein [Candidatus Saganbacteria bacterium]